MVPLRSSLLSSTFAALVVGAAFTLGLTTSGTGERTPSVAATAAVAEARPRAEEPIVNAVGIPGIKRDSDGLFRITLRVNDVETRFIVDTGATTTVLTGKDAERAGVQTTHSGRDMIDTAAGPSPMRWAKLDRVDIGSAQIRGVDAAVVEQGLSTSLLGQNILRRLGSVTFRGEHMTIG